MVLYHVTTPRKARKYRETGKIIKPVRGFTTLKAAMAWAIKTKRTVVYKIDISEDMVTAYKLPDHNNAFGEAWWIDADVSVEYIKCVFSADRHA